MSFSEVKDLPVAYRKWFISRIVQDINQKNEAISGNQNQDAGHENMSKLREYEDKLSKNS
tara:strand:- start:3573 stop:3752 length:180 start_codon:yes stop_codon:yes gene_type:complete